MGCAGRQDTPEHAFLLVRQPDAEVVRIDITDHSDEAIALRAVIRLSHGNDLDLPLGQVRYRFWIEGLGGVTYEDIANRTLPRQGEQTFDVTGSLALGSTKLSALAGQDVGVRGQVAFVPPGEIRKILTDANLPLPRSRFSASRRLGDLEPVSDSTSGRAED